MAGESEALKTFERGLEVLVAIARAPVGLGVSALARAAGFSRQSVYRALAVLERRNFVRRSPASGRYLLSQDLIALIDRRGTDFERMTEIRKVMRTLCAETLWPVVVSGPQGLRMVVWETTDRETPLRFEQFAAGFDVPRLESASGLAFVAHLPTEERDRLLDRLAESTEPFAELARSRGRCLASLRAYRREGYAMTTHPPFALRIRRKPRRDSALDAVSGFTTSLAVPVLVGGRPVACLAIRYIDSAMTRATAARRYVPRLKQAAQQISALVASHTP